MPDLLQLTRTSKETSGRVSDFLRRRFHRLLEDYRLSALAFTALMEQCPMVISGHTALQWLLSLPVGSSPLAVYVHTGHWDVLRDYLLRQGYVRGERGRRMGGPFDTGATALTGLQAILPYVNVGQRNSDILIRRIDVFLVQDRVDITRPIPFQPTTASMTYITASSVHTLFPEMTFKRQALVALHAGVPVTHVGIAVMTDISQIGEPMGQEISRQSVDGFSVRWPTVSRSIAPEEAPCGFACAELRQTAWKGTFGLSFHSPNIEISPQAKRTDTLMAEFTNFLIGGRCRNRHCPLHPNMYVHPMAFYLSSRSMPSIAFRASKTFRASTSLMALCRSHLPVPLGFTYCC